MKTIAFPVLILTLCLMWGRTSAQAISHEHLAGEQFGYFSVVFINYLKMQELLDIDNPKQMSEDQVAEFINHYYGDLELFLAKIHQFKINLKLPEDQTKINEPETQVNFWLNKWYESGLLPRPKGHVCTQANQQNYYRVVLPLMITLDETNYQTSLISGQQEVFRLIEELEKCRKSSQ